MKTLFLYFLILIITNYFTTNYKSTSTPISMIFNDSSEISTPSAFNDDSLTIICIEVKDSTNPLCKILDAVASHERKIYGVDTSLLYSVLITRTPKKYRKAMNGYESVYLTGIDKEWPMPYEASNNILGYIKRDNIFFIVEDGGGFQNEDWSRVFLITDTLKTFILSAYRKKEVFEEDDSVCRIWCNFLYKDGRFFIREGSCYNNDGDLDLFKE